ncbi:desiccation protectant protein Lea14 homolog [Apium graveolens]|uniref:desiccation protectant protein Lea14 homolog n=1 Tax=Apium graveolens TaxID=4045 RepID=UPI003D79A323
MSGLLEKAKEYVSEKVAEMKKPEATLRSVGLKEVSRECITYDAKVSVSNPYSTSIPICEVSYTLKSANREIASGTIQDPGSLKGNESTVLDVGLNVPHSVLWSLARDIGEDWDIDYDLGINLVIDLPVFGNISIPASSKGEIKLPTFTDLWTT